MSRLRSSEQRKFDWWNAGKDAFAWKANGSSGMVKEKPGEAIVVEVADTLAIAKAYACQVR